MRIDSRIVIRFSFVAAAAALTVACQSTPKAPVIETPPPQQMQPNAQPLPPVQQQPQQSRSLPPIQQGPIAPPVSSVGPGSIQDFVVNAGDRVYFDFDSFSIRGDAKPVLDAQSSWLSRYPAVTVRIEGNADERGTQEYNFALGERRANAVRDYLVSHGVAAARISVVSYGKERPIDGGSTEDAWQHNRNGHTAIVGGAR